jgi:hypothetical protein
MRITLKKPRLTAEMPAFVTYRINRFSLSFPKLPADQARVELHGAALSPKT